MSTLLLAIAGWIALKVKTIEINTNNTLTVLREELAKALVKAKHTSEMTDKDKQIAMMSKDSGGEARGRQG